jgi:uncharacterized protein (TIGR03085 family)
MSRSANVAQSMRRALCEELLRVGPDAPTLCEGWNTRDLATHLIVRETRPDAAAGILLKPFAGYAARVQAKVGRAEWSSLVDKIRSGPPLLSPMRLGPVDDLTNTLEYFVHCEDIRRGTSGWEPRSLSSAEDDALFNALKRGARLMTRRAPAGLVLSATGRPVLVAKKGSPEVTVSGPVGELVLFVYGRQAASRVTFDGPDQAIAAMRTAKFGV